MKPDGGTRDIELLTTLFEAIPDIVTYTELESGRLVEVNEEFTRISGFSREEALGKTAAELNFWVDPEARSSFVDLLRRNGRIKGLATRMRLKWGEVRNFELSAAVMEQGAKSFVITVLRDVQDRTAAEEQLRKSAFLLARAEEMAKIGSWEFDYMTKKVSGSMGAARIYGVRPEDLDVKVIEEVPLPEYRSALNEARDRHIAEGEPYDIRFKIRRKDGSILDIHSRALWNPAMKRLFGILRDVTEEARAEEALQAIISQRDSLIHELYHRTANTLQMILSMMRLEETRADTQSCPAMLDRVSRRIESIALVHESLYEGGNLSRIDLAEYIPKLVAASARKEGRRRAVKFEYRLKKALVLVDVAVPCGLIVEELIDNVVEHAYPDGEGAALISAGREDDGTIRLAVEDDGRGAPPSIASMSDTSLGLYLVRALCESQLHGEISFVTSPAFPVRSPSRTISRRRGSSRGRRATMCLPPHTAPTHAKPSGMSNLEGSSEGEAR